jgi:hypothetical protein
MCYMPYPFLAYFPYYEEKMKAGLCDLHAVCVSPYELLDR